MKTRKFSLARIMTAALVLLLTFALAIPAFASSGSAYQTGPFNVTVTPDDSTAKPADNSDTIMINRFTAYAIFVGNINPNGTGVEDYKPGTTTTPGSSVLSPNSNMLVNIEWGDGIDVNKFMKSLIKDETVTLTDGRSIADELNRYLSGISEKVDTDYDFKTTAVARAVAKMLEANSNNSTLIQTFAKLANKALITTNGKKSTWKAEEDKWEDGAWNIELDRAGYYLIVDEFRLVDEENQLVPTDSSVSAFILGVFGNSTVNMKATTPTPDKTILNPDDSKGNGNGSAFEVGDEIKFRLTGTLPENYDEYETYYYAFHDTLSRGLSDLLSTKGITVYIVTGTDKLTLSQNVDYTAYPTDLPSGATQIDIEITDLKAVAASKGFAITHNSVIYVEYSAEINDDAVTYGAPGNPNTVNLEFSNNPHNDSHGKSTDITVYVYAFGLNIVKISDDIDSTTEKVKPLAGAEFEITDSEGNKAYFSKVTTEDEEGNVTSTEYVLQGWLSSGEEVPSGMVTTVVTDSKGNLNIRGLGSNQYILTETKAPKGYNLLKNPITVDIQTTIDESTGEMIEFTVTVTNNNLPDGSNAEPVSTTYKNDGSDESNAGIFHSGLIPMDVTNYRAPILPGTGGIGLVIFYVLGGLLLVGAATYIIVSGRKKSKQQQQ